MDWTTIAENCQVQVEGSVLRIMVDLGHVAIKAGSKLDGKAKEVTRDIYTQTLGWAGTTIPLPEGGGANLSLRLVAATSTEASDARQRWEDRANAARVAEMEREAADLRAQLAAMRAATGHPNTSQEEAALAQERAAAQRTAPPVGGSPRTPTGHWHDAGAEGADASSPPSSPRRARRARGTDATPPPTDPPSAAAP